MPLGIMISTSSARDTQRLCPNNIVYTEHIRVEYNLVHCITTFFFLFPVSSTLIHCDLVMPYGDIELGEYWLRLWLVA